MSRQDRFLRACRHEMADCTPVWFMRQAGGDVIGADWRTSLADAWRRVGSEAGIQGNLDPAVLLAPRDILEACAREILDQASGTAGHIFNLGHGMPPTAPESAVELLVDIVHSHRPAAADLSAWPSVLV